MAEVSKWREPSKESEHRKFWEHIKAGGRVWRDDPLNNVQEWLDLQSLDGDVNAIVKYGYKNLSIPNPLAQLPEAGCVLGMPYPDWPKHLTTFAERKTYQLGVAHGKAVQHHEDAKRITALERALSIQTEWVKASLSCKQHEWDGDQREAAESTCAEAISLLGIRHPGGCSTCKDSACGVRDNTSEMSLCPSHSVLLQLKVQPETN